MKWLKALFAALIAFFAALRGQPEPQETQDQIIQETQEKLDEIPQMPDDELTDLAIDTGLVRPDPGPGAGGAEGLAGTGDGGYSGCRTAPPETRRPKQ